MFQERKFQRILRCTGTIFLKLSFVLSGRATHILNGKEYPLGRGDIFVLNPSDYHGIRVIEELELINIMLDESLIRTQLLDALLSCKRDIMFTLQEEEFDSVYPLFARLVEEFEAGRKYKEIFMKDILECIFITIARQFAFAYNPSSDADKEPVRRANSLRPQPFSRRFVACGSGGDYRSE